MNAIILLLLGILFICIGFVFGFTVGIIMALDAINKPTKERENKE